jgi:hypothetical protein
VNALAVLVLAIVTQNQAPLRAAPREAAPQQAVLWQGEVLEVRGARGDYLLVYDYRRERSGYLLASQARSTTLAPEEAPELLAVVRFLRDTPGAEALGMSYAAAYLKAVPAAALTAEPFDALGSMAERLAKRASAPRPGTRETTVAAQLEVVAQQGVGMHSFERDGAIQICYDGEMFRRVLAMPSASADQRARAALGLTRHDCVDPNLGPTVRFQLDQWRAEVLDRVPENGLSSLLSNRLHLRRAGVWAALAFGQARRGEQAHVAADRALNELALVNKAELVDDDLTEYADAAVRVGASRWAAEPLIGPRGKLSVRTAPGAPGETCVSVYAGATAAAAAATAGSEPLVVRCTYGLVWTASAVGNSDGSALVLAVQPLDTWRELWVFRRTAVGWRVDVLPPGSDGPGLGYIEFAGWVPGAKRLLVAREVRAGACYRRRFEIVRLDTLITEAQAATPDRLPGFRRWEDPNWSSTSISLR